MVAQFTNPLRGHKTSSQEPVLQQLSQPLAVLLIGLSTLLAGAALAHHNMSALFDFNNRVTMTGTLTKFDWRNPHIQLIVEVNKDGQMETWTLEGPPG